MSITLHLAAIRVRAPRYWIPRFQSTYQGWAVDWLNVRAEIGWQKW